MTNKVQYSKKFPDGSIIVVGGDTVDEFEINYETFRSSAVGKRLLSDVSAVNAPPPPKTNSAQQAPQTVSGDAERVILPDDAVLSIVWNGDKYHGEVEPFPGTKFSVRVWPEVLDNLPGFDKDTTRTMIVGGFEVDFVKNEKGYPQKVVAFV